MCPRAGRHPSFARTGSDTSNPRISQGERDNNRCMGASGKMPEAATTLEYPCVCLWLLVLATIRARKGPARWLTGQVRIQANVSAHHLRDQTVVLGLVGRSFKAFRVQSRHLGRAI